MTTRHKYLFLGIVFIAIFFRFYLINQMPGGLFPDMAANGLDINLMQQGHLQPFYERGNGREALFFYMEWASVALFGKGVWQFSIVSALVGVWSVILVFFVTRRLFLVGEDSEDEAVKRRSVHIALLAMFLMAVSSWYTVLSRTAFRANLIPLFSLLTVYFLLRAYQSLSLKTRWWFSFLCGASFAVGFYTYIAYRIMAPILFMMVLWPLLASLKTKTFGAAVKKYFFPGIVFAIGFIIFIYPIAKYFYTHPGSFVGRSGQVSAFNPELYVTDGQQLHGKPPLAVSVSAIGEVTKVSLLGYFKQGDLNWRHNISGFPFLSQLVSPFFGLGLLASLILGLWYFFAPVKRARYWKYYALTGWFWGMLIPVVTTAEAIPHGLRSVGTVAPVFIISAWALYESAAWVYRQHQKIWERCFCKDSHASELHPNPHSAYFSPLRRSIVEAALKLVVVCFVLALIFQTYFLYFVYAYNSPENFYYFRSDLTPVSQYLSDHCAQSRATTGQSSKEKTYLVLDQFSVQTTDYLTSDRYGNFNDPCNVPYHQVDPERAYQLPPLHAGDQVIFAQSSIFDTKKFKQYHPEAHLHQELRNKFGQAVLAVYVIQ